MGGSQIWPEPAESTLDSPPNCLSLFDPAYLLLWAGFSGNSAYDVSSVYDELSEAFIRCKELQACALVKYHSNYHFMGNMADRQKILGSQKANVLPYRSFSKSFERSLLKVEAEQRS